MTLLVLDVRLPAGGVDTDRALWSSLAELGPQLAAYALSFTMLGTFWLPCTRPAQAGGSDRTLAWALLSYLFFVTTLPFSASTLADHVHLALTVRFSSSSAFLAATRSLSFIGSGVTWLASRGAAVASAKDVHHGQAQHTKDCHAESREARRHLC